MAGRMQRDFFSKPLGLAGQDLATLHQPSQVIREGVPAVEDAAVVPVGAEDGGERGNVHVA